jgi:hypothetical protein
LLIVVQKTPESDTMKLSVAIAVLASALAEAHCQSTPLFVIGQPH